MKVRTIEYSRLFNLQDYNNERISVAIDLEEGEDEVKTVFKAYKDIMAIHNMFEVHRELVRRVYSLGEEIEEKERRKKAEEIELANLQRKKEEMEGKIQSWKEGKLDPTAVDERMLCEFGALNQRIDDTIHEISRYEELIEAFRKERELLEKALEVLEDLISNGTIHKYLHFFTLDLIKKRPKEIASLILEWEGNE
ncbi:MAG: hypothetical protein ACP6IS_11135 [Candidatus Asgardarchaeia archaeon]